MERLRIILGVYVVRGPLAGLTWHHLQYGLGLRQLGHDVYLYEDSGDDEWSCWDPSTRAMGTDPSYGLRYAERVYRGAGLGDRWAYLDAHTGTWHGPVGKRMPAVFAAADLFINVSGVNGLRPWLTDVPARALVDTDPAFTQIRHLTKPQDAALAKIHTTFHTFATNFGTPGCGVPDDGLPWRPTRQPIVLDCWPVVAPPPRAPYTTVMQWESYAPQEYGGVRFGMKSASFAVIARLPAATRASLEIALGGHGPSTRLRADGWQIIDPAPVSFDPPTYRRYIQRSRGEVAVAKHGYVISRSGWFSERSAAYLASGRPVITQDTGFARWLPTGRGLLAYGDADGAARALEEVERDYGLHSAAARRVAEDAFGARQVLTELVDTALNP